MKKNKKQLIVLIVVLAVIVLALAGWLIGRKAAAGKQAESADTSISLCNLGNVTSLSFSAGDTGYDCVLGADGQWTLSGDPAFVMDAKAMGNITEKLAALTAYRAFQPEGGLEVYGLDAPAASFTASDGDGTLTLLFGGYNAGKYYALVGGDDLVYTVGSTFFDTVNKSALDLMALEAIPNPEEAEISAFELTAGELTARFENQVTSSLGEDGKTLTVCEWYRQDAGGERLPAGDGAEFKNSKYYLTTQSFQGAEVYKYTDRELAEYGLDDPALILRLRYAGEAGEEELELRFGNAGMSGEDAVYYCAMAGSENIYRISATFVDYYTALLTGSFPGEEPEQPGAPGLEYQTPDL